MLKNRILQGLTEGAKDTDTADADTNDADADKHT